jgi:hypothetical protein
MLFNIDLVRVKLSKHLSQKLDKYKLCDSGKLIQNSTMLYFMKLFQFKFLLCQNKLYVNRRLKDRTRRARWPSISVWIEDFQNVAYVLRGVLFQFKLWNSKMWRPKCRSKVPLQKSLFSHKKKSQKPYYS